MILETLKQAFGSSRVGIVAVIASEVRRGIKDGAESIEEFVLPTAQKFFPGAEEGELIALIQALYNLFTKKEKPAADLHSKSTPALGEKPVAALEA